jgi:5-formyltetrahydrofolate cyclo-ligase
MRPRKDIRKNMRVLRSQLSPSVQQQASKSICEHLQKLPIFLESQNIAFYWAINQEIDLFSLIQQALNMGKQCFLPVCNKNELNFSRYEKNTALQKNQFAIPEPMGGVTIAPQDLELVFVPLLAFDSFGNRLGTGMGFYDRSFAFLNSQSRLKPKLLGVGYGFQQVQRLQAEVWDVRLDGVVSYNTNLEVNNLDWF